MADELRIRIKTARGRVADDSTQTIYGVSHLGQNYGILVTKGNVHKLYVYVERQNVHFKQHLHFIGDELGLEEKKPIIEYQDDREETILKAISEIQMRFEVPPSNTIFGGTCGCYMKIVPKCWPENPDTFLKRGYVLARRNRTDERNCPFAYQTAIYLGKEKVVHISTEGNEDENYVETGLVPRKGRLVGDFLERKTDELFVVDFRVRIREFDEIAEAAETHAEVDSLWGKYDIHENNCQHFVAYCAARSKFMITDAVQAGTCSTFV